MPQWPDEVLAAISALEDKYDIELVSGPHHAEWVERHDRMRAALKPFADALALAESVADGRYSPITLLEDCRAHVTLYEFAMARKAHG